MKGVSDFGFMSWIACIGNVLIFKGTMALKALYIDLKQRKEISSQRLDLQIYTVSNA